MFLGYLFIEILCEIGAHFLPRYQNINYNQLYKRNN